MKNMTIKNVAADYSITLTTLKGDFVGGPKTGFTLAFTNKTDSSKKFEILLNGKNHHSQLTFTRETEKGCFNISNYNQGTFPVTLENDSFVVRKDDFELVLTIGDSWAGGDNLPADIFEQVTALASALEAPAAKTQTVFEPSNLEAILNLPFGKKTIGRTKSARHLLAYVLHAVHMAAYVREDLHAPLGVSEMAQMAKGNFHAWSNLKTVLLDRGVIACDGVYRVGKKSFHYAKGPALANASWKRSKETHTFILPVPSLDIRNKVEDFTIDAGIIDEAMGFARSERGWNNEETDVWQYYLEEGFHTAYTVASTGRVYGGWSNVPRELRGAFLLQGKRTLEVDISNCQPLLLTNLYGNRAAREKAKYQTLVESGLFYEDVMNHTGINDRDAIKRMVMKWLCGGGDSLLIEDYFDCNYPFLAGIIAGHKKELYKKVALMLQKYESDVVVNTIGEEFPIVSMHDAAICPFDIADEVCARTKEVIKKEYGLDANVKIEDKRGAITGRKYILKNIAA
jgi:hypothetical protein